MRTSACHSAHIAHSWPHVEMTVDAQLRPCPLLRRQFGVCPAGQMPPVGPVVSRGPEKSGGGDALGFGMPRLSDQMQLSVPSPDSGGPGVLAVAWLRTSLTRHTVGHDARRYGQNVEGRTHDRNAANW